MERKVTYPGLALPYALLAPQILIIAVFFYLPAGQALWMSTLLQDPLGFSVQFVGLENFTNVLSDPAYRETIVRTLFFTTGVTICAMVPAILLAFMADKAIRGATAYKTILIIPYAIAPAVAGALWLFLFNPSVGIVSHYLGKLGVDWNPRIQGGDAMALIIIASAWKQIAYNFVFFLAGLQSIPKSLIEAAKIDGASESRRFWTIIFPLLSPTTFFLIVVNFVYAFFETFGVVHASTQGGPGKSTEIMIYKVWYDGFIAQDLGRSAAQSVILMVIVVALTVLQFRFVERKVHY
ncbi:MAG: sn-glycerol-3-phosphate ABC transporter permease UgpA [Methylocystis sp.]|nr:sn-glycerol-3-phosphate ABC transporter permease UgpA [Methylocystis sp.]